jgi:hypothetical protein
MNPDDMDPRGRNGILGGRPRLQIDLVELEKLCALQCTHAEIASWFLCSIESIDKRIADRATLYEVDDSDSPGQKINLNFHEIMQRGYARGKISMRRQQIKMLNEGNGTMGVWLGKQYLGQKDIVHHANPDGSAVENAASVVDLFFDRLIAIVERRGEVGSDPAPKSLANGNGNRAHVVEVAHVGADEATPPGD